MSNSELLKSLSSPRRQAILHFVWEEEQSAGAIHAAMPDITFGAVSLQLKALSGAGLITARADGRHRFYRANRDAIGTLRGMLEQMWDSALWKLSLAAELEQSRRGPRPRTRKRGPSKRRSPKRHHHD